MLHSRFAVPVLSAVPFSRRVLSSAASRGKPVRAFGSSAAVRSWAVALACVMPTAAFAQLEVTAPWVRATVPQQPATGAFMELRAEQAQTLVAADSPVAKTVELHEMRMEDDIMRMRQVTEIALPAGEPVALKPGGYHIMLIGLHQQMQAGENVPLTLTLQAADGKRSTVEVQAEVRALNAGAGANAHHGHAPTHHGHGGAEPGHAHHSHSHSHSAGAAAPAHHAAVAASAQTSAASAEKAAPAHLPALPATVELHDCWVRALPTPLPAAAYMQIRNQGDAAVTLQAVQTPGFAQTMLHSTITENGMAKMVHQDSIPVAAGATVALAPGGLHIMLEQAAQPLQPGETLPLSVQFQGYAARDIACEVRSARG